MATFSVLMSVYKDDSPKFLREALESVFEKQTRKPDEIVIVIDGPVSDKILGVINTFKMGKERLVKILPQDENKGLGESLRFGSLSCSSEYICRMDSDDISFPNRFEILFDYVEKHPNIDVIGTDIAEFESDISEENKRIRSCPHSHKDIVKMGKSRSPMNHVSVCIKKESLEKNGGYLSLPYCEDYYLWLRLIVGGCVFENINEPLVYVRLGDRFLKKRGSKIRIKSWKVLQKFMLKHKMISFLRYFYNMFSIRFFVYSPSFIKNFLYSKVLRK